jgi:hypothetical protein
MLAIVQISLNSDGLYSTKCCKFGDRAMFFTATKCGGAASCGCAVNEKI